MSKAVTVKLEDKKKDMPKQAMAVGRYVHISPRKARLVADLIRNSSVSDAITQLQVLRKRASRPFLKVLLSAVANAEHNLKWKKESLKISKITVDQGPVTKRYKPRA